MLYTELTQKAMEICFQAHKEQRDKGDLPYVFHPFHLAERMETEEEACTALLHDVAEDTTLTLEDLAAEGFPPAVMEALALLTHTDSTPYLDYVRRLKDDPLAARVKLADLRHNSTAGRIKDPGEKERRRMRKYLRAQAILTGGEADLEKMTLKLTCRIPVQEKETDRGKEAETGSEKATGKKEETEMERGPEYPALLTVFLESDGRVREYVLSLPDGSGEETFPSLPPLLERVQQVQLSAAETVRFISSL